MREPRKPVCDKPPGKGAETAFAGASSSVATHERTPQPMPARSAAGRALEPDGGCKGGLSIRGGQVGKQRKSFLSVANEGADRR